MMGEVGRTNKVERDDLMKLAVIADDLTGALDTGIKFAGGSTQVQVWAGGLPGEHARSADVLVVDGELRHSSPEQAYRDCFDIVRRVLDAGAERLYIKTDSALRGNIGPMFQAALDASGWEFAAFVPAFPQMDRITRKGIHYNGGVPIHESVFGKDPFEPVRSSQVADLFRGLKVETRLFEKGDSSTPMTGRPTVGIFDAESREDLDRIAEKLKKAGMFQLLGGCAGFASRLSGPLGLEQDVRSLAPDERPLLVLCGSLNPISKDQLAFGESRGGIRLSLDSTQLVPEYVNGPEGERLIDRIENAMESGRDILLDTAGPMGENQENNRRETVAQALGALMFRLLHSSHIEAYQPMVIGGDTLMGLIHHLPASQLSPLAEPVPGVVLSQIQVGDGRTRTLLSKSGGFGKKELFSQLHEALARGVARGPFQG